MNPQKLAGQCAKLKCCLNFEIDAYAEAVKQLPSKETVLQTKDSDFFLFKTDILTRTLTYSTDKRMAANLTVIPASRAFEIIALNKQGVKPDKLIAEEVGDTQREYIDLTDQDALTRFDKAKKKKQKNKQGTQVNQSQKNSGKKESVAKQEEISTAENIVHKSGSQRRNKRKQNNKDQKNSNIQTHDPKDA